MHQQASSRYVTHYFPALPAPALRLIAWCTVAVIDSERTCGKEKNEDIRYYLFSIIF